MGGAAPFMIASKIQMIRRMILSLGIIFLVAVPTGILIAYLTLWMFGVPRPWDYFNFDLLPAVAGCLFAIPLGMMQSVFFRRMVSPTRWILAVSLGLVVVAVLNGHVRPSVQSYIFIGAVAGVAMSVTQHLLVRPMLPGPSWIILTTLSTAAGFAARARWAGDLELAFPYRSEIIGEGIICGLWSAAGVLLVTYA